MVIFSGAFIERRAHTARSAAWEGNLLKLRFTELMGFDVLNPYPSPSPLIVSAAYSGKVDIIRHLLNSGVDIEAKDKFGGTALARAAQMNQIETVRMLLEAGADTDAQDDQGNTPIDLSLLHARTADRDAEKDPSQTILLLRTAGGEPNTTER